MSSLIDFESKNEIDYRRSEKRKKMDKLLKKAERKYEDKEKLKQMQNEAILPDIQTKISHEQRDIERALKRKAKKHKKEKSNKSKKSKSSKKHKSAKSSTESSEEENEWVEKTNGDDDDDTETVTNKLQDKLERQGWMLSNELDSFLNLSSKRNSKKKLQEKPEEKMGQHSRELNPYWKDGGSGLPTTSTLQDHHATTTTATKSAPMMGNDGGLAWWNKALKRCKEMAEEQGCSLEEVAAERYGSLKILKNRIKEAELFVKSNYKSSSSSSSSFSSTRKDKYPTRTFKKSNYDKNDDDSSFQTDHNIDNDGYKRSKEGCRDSNDKTCYLPCRWRKNDYRTDNNSHDIKHEKGGYRHNEEHVDVTNVDRICKEKKQKLPSSSSSSSSSDDDVAVNDKTNSPPPKPPPTLTDEDKNKLSARILKAELMGDMNLAEELRRQLVSSSDTNHLPNTQPQSKKTKNKSIKDKFKDVDDDDDEEEEEMLLVGGRRGVVRPYPDHKHPVEAGGGRRKKQKVETHKDGVRTKYFHDDDQHTIKSLYEQEKLRSGHDDDEMMFNKLAGKAMQLIDNDEYTLDDEVLNKESRKKSDSLIESRQRQLAIIDQKKMSSRINKCTSCFNNTEKHLIVSIGNKVYLSLPRYKSMVEGHCLIVPIQHTTQCTSCDEDVYEEIMTYKKSLVSMFRDRDEDVVFMETCRNLKYYPHLTIECIPLPREEGDMAPIYFKKAITECDAVWNQNKKLIEMKSKNVRQSIPVGFPYFHVAFGLDEGFGHVIEDENSFPHYFGREVVGGMLDVDPTLWRKPKVDSFEQQRIKVLNFSKIWKPYDHTSVK